MSDERSPPADHCRIDPSVAALRASLGLPEKGSVVRLCYLERTEMIVAAVDVPNEHEIPVTSLYTRHRSTANYRKLFGPDALTAIASFVPVRGTGEILGLVRKQRADNWRGFDSPEILRIQPVDGSTTRAMSNDEFSAKHRDANCLRAWCSELMEASNDGATVIAKVGFLRPFQAPNGAKAAKVDYRIARVSLADGEVFDLAALPGVFW